jgi:PmbA protein
MATKSKDVAKQAVGLATKAGAADAEAFLQTNREMNINVRDGRVESVKEADSRGLGLRVIVDGRMALVYTSDFRPTALEGLAQRAVALAKNAEPDPANAFALPATAPATTLDLYDPAVAKLTPDQLIARAVEAEKVARGADKKVTATQFAGAGRSDGETWVVNSKGVEWGFPETAVFNFVGVLAADEGGKQRGGNEGSSQRYLADLTSTEEIGKEAAKRAARMVGAKKAPTQKLPVVMHRDMVSNWVNNMFNAFSGEQVFKKASYLSDKMGQSIASPLITLVDDPFRKRALGGAPFDDEGVPCQKIVLLEKGVVKSFVYNLKWANKAGAKSTGNASRNYSSLPGIGSHSMYIENGTTPADDLIKGIDVGFYLVSTGAFGYDNATGGWSYQASGLMIEKGALTYPVTDVSLASDSLTMLKNVQKVGNDLVFDGGTNAPSLLIAEMALSGT